MITNTKMISCPNCKYENPSNHKLCIRCSSTLNSMATDKIEETPELEAIFRGGSKDVGKVLYLHIHGDNQSVLLHLREGGNYTIGRRDPHNEYYPDVDLTDYQGAERGISRRHAELTYVEDMLRIIDLASANYTYLNDMRLVEYQPRIVRDNDSLRFGHLKVSVQFGEAE